MRQVQTNIEITILNKNKRKEKVSLVSIGQQTENSVPYHMYLSKYLIDRYLFDWSNEFVEFLNNFRI